MCDCGATDRAHGINASNRTRSSSPRRTNSRLRAGFDLSISNRRVALPASRCAPLPARPPLLSVGDGGSGFLRSLPAVAAPRKGRRPEASATLGPSFAPFHLSPLCVSSWFSCLTFAHFLLRHNSPTRIVFISASAFLRKRQQRVFERACSEHAIGRHLGRVRRAGLLAGCR
jgi:hypothetical protein